MVRVSSGLGKLWVGVKVAYQTHDLEEVVRFNHPHRL
jgi:hypothetical protein